MWFLLACAVPDSPDDLYGLWANTDEELVRVWDMAETHDDVPDTSPAYRIYNYEPGTDPVVVQVGGYDVLEEHIVTSPLGEGVDYSNLLVAAGSDWFELEVDKATGATRVYTLVDALP